MRIILFLALFALGVPATRAELASRPEPPRTVTIVVVGDSLAEGLWGGLYRRFARERGVRIVNAARASTGFNADSYDDEVDRLLARGRIDLLIVQAGANDRQRALALDGRRSAAFGSPRWFDFYAQRLTYFLARAQRRNVPILWIGLPVMRDERFDQGMRLISRLQRDYAEAHGALFLDIAHFTADAEGAFVETLPMPGRGMRRFRHEDGVHFWEFGYDRVAGEVVAAIRAGFPDVLPEGRARAEGPSHKP